MPRTRTLDQQHARARTRASSALVGFTEAADELVAAAEELTAVANAADAVVEQHAETARAARIEADLNRTRAARIRGLLK